MQGIQGCVGRSPEGCRSSRQLRAGRRCPWRLWTSSARLAYWPRRAALRPATLRRLGQLLEEWWGV